MFSNLSATITDPGVNYPITDSNLPFAEYIRQTRAIVGERREDLDKFPLSAEQIIEANSPFEYAPSINSGKPQYGALLIHGLLDSPFTYREIGAHLQSQGILSRSILLPGHGTRPSDLFHVSYHDWLQAVRYGIESLKREVDHIFLIGYSTGAALSIYHAMQDSKIAGIILLSPAIKVRTPVDVFASWFHFMNRFSSKDRHWVYHLDEIDYVKYKSIAFNGVKQVTRLTESIREMRNEYPLNIPMYMIVSREDETISSHDAIDYFTSQHHPDSRMLLYTSIDHSYPDSRIITKKSIHQDKNIAHIAHPALSFSPNNPHYGQRGDYINASRDDKNYVYGAYNRIEIISFDLLTRLRLAKAPRRVLTYNPDFDNMASSIASFIKGESIHS